MSNMQSIIVYRNPVEAAFWEAMLNGAMIPVFGGIVVFLVVFLVLSSLLNLERKGSVWKTQLILSISTLLSCFTVWLLWI